jgi:hypothetical protein
VNYTHVVNTNVKWAYVHMGLHYGHMSGQTNSTIGSRSNALFSEGEFFHTSDDVCQIACHMATVLVAMIRFPGVLVKLLHDRVCPEVLAVARKEEPLSMYGDMSKDLLALEGPGADMGMGCCPPNTLINNC